ncbi:MAG TPA: hypothetical protein VKB46_01090 [Pyrinomonadaceae bacterium]|nr:hypothetical protein [Pyrinomonadaceae bacterium]
MATPANSPLSNLLNDAPPQTSTPPQPAPWTAPTADRILRTTAVPVVINYSSIPGTLQQWGPNTAAFNAVSPPDPTTGQQYFCLNPGIGMHYDFSLNRVQAGAQLEPESGEFSAIPVLPGVSDGFTAYLGWAYAVNSTSGADYFLCAVSWPAPLPNTLHFTDIDIFGILDPLNMRHYQPKSAVVQPVGVWATGDLVWFANTDGSLWQVNISDVAAILEAGTGSLQQINSTGLVQAVISDGASTPTYYVLSAVANGSGYDLVEFPAGDPASAVTIQTGWTPGGIKTTPDGAVWRVVPDFSSTTQPTAAQVAYLTPPFPANGQTPTWIDPFASADPAFYPAGTTQTIMDAVPISATNILLRTTENYAAEQDSDWNYPMSWQLTRVAIGVLDQPAIAFPAYTGDQATAYTEISQALINAPSATYDIRAQYPTLSSSEASAYYTAVKLLSVPPNFSDASAWQQVQSDLTGELFNLTFTLSFWEGTQSLVSLQNQLNSQAITYVAAALAIPTEATLIDKNAATVNALTAIGAEMGTAGTILGLVATVIGTCTFPVGTIITGVLSAAASLAALFCSTSASLATKYVINVSDPMYIISAKLGDLEGVLNQLFSNTLTEIGSALQACATDAGRLLTVAELTRNQAWVNNTAQVIQDSNSNGAGTPPSFSDYYNACVISFFQAFVPLITAVNTNIETSSGGGTFPSYKGKPVYLGPIYSFDGGDGLPAEARLLQYASPHDQSKPLGQDLDVVLFETFALSYDEVLLNWGIPYTPSWFS